MVKYHVIKLQRTILFLPFWTLIQIQKDTHYAFLK
ncbi:UNVERIFIED_CONTAM: hypothetical protein GTU68_057648 [Idotea baltica]|nr:hypothetical protein [Idotea baltica]